MKNSKYETPLTPRLTSSGLLIVLCVLIFSAATVLAQGGSGGGGGSGGNNGNGDSGASTQGTASQSENQGGTQDQNTIEVQNRNQEQIQNPSVPDGGVPVQNQEQERIRVEEREQIQNSGELRSYINAQGGGGGATNTPRNRVQVATKAMVAAQHLVGQYGNEFAGIGQQLGSSTQVMLQAEEQIRTRSRFIRFLFGGDEDSAQMIREHIYTNNERIERLRQYLNECACDEEVREMLREQLRNIEREQERLRQVAEDEEATWGLFSWRF